MADFQEDLFGGTVKQLRIKRPKNNAMTCNFEELTDVFGLDSHELYRLLEGFRQLSRERLLINQFTLYEVFIYLRGSGRWTDYLICNTSAYLGIPPREFPLNWVHKGCEGGCLCL